MAQSKRNIFRENALKHYMENGERTVLPRFISPPITLLFWCLLILLLCGALLTWLWRVPVYLTNVGEIGTMTGEASPVPIVVVLLAQNQIALVHPGMPAQLVVGTGGVQWQQSVVTVNSLLMNPTEVRQRYGLDRSVNLLVTRPSAVALIPVPASLSLRLYLGSIVQVKIQLGSQRLLSLLPIFNQSGGM